MYSSAIFRSACKVVTTCSPRNFDLVKDLGADLILDYVSTQLMVSSTAQSSYSINSLLQKSSDVGSTIREATNSTIDKIFDTVSVESSAKICAEAFGPRGGTYCNLLGIDCPRDDAESIFFLGYDMSGELYKYEGEIYPAKLETFQFARKWYTVAEKLWAEGKWKPHPQRVGQGGLVGVMDGMQEMREGRVSGQKLVYLVDDSIQLYRF